MRRLVNIKLGFGLLVVAWLALVTDHVHIGVIAGGVGLAIATIDAALSNRARRTNR